jgi:hypothetical protein
MLSKAFDLPPETKHRIVTGGHERDVFLEFDQYPIEAAHRTRAAGDLPPGIAMVTLEHPDLDAVSAEWVSPPRRREGLVYGDRWQAVTRAPDGTLVELVSSSEPTQGRAPGRAQGRE